MSVLSKEFGGEHNIECIAKDVENYLGSRRSALIGKGDAQKMFNYFLESQCKNPIFFSQSKSMKIDVWQIAFG
jgi:hypothetical protein